jgi:hypothetical protein
LEIPVHDQVASFSDVVMRQYIMGRSMWQSKTAHLQPRKKRERGKVKGPKIPLKGIPPKT